MRKGILVSTMVLVVAASACGPSKEDEVAAKRGCELGKQYRVGFVLSEDERKTAGITEQDHQRARSQIVSRHEGFESGLSHANPEKVKELIQRTCPDDGKHLAAALNHYAETAGGPKNGTPKGYGLFLNP